MNVPAVGQKPQWLLTRFARSHLNFLGQLPRWQFVPVLALWTLGLKTVLVPVVALLNHLIFTPLGLANLYTLSPLLKLADYLTARLYGLPLLGWNVLSLVIQLLLVALLFPGLATLLSQVVPLHTLAKKIPSQRWRIALSMGVLGALQLLAYGEFALLLSGAIVAVPLVYVFVHWRHRASLRTACIMTFGVHATTNAFVVLFRGFFGGV